jgi:Heparinase II/III-like protein/Heparinase II/III N-terminus
VTSIVKKLRGRSLAELRLRARQALSARLERLGGPPGVRGAAPGLHAERGFAALERTPGGARAIAAALVRRDPDGAQRLQQLSDALAHGQIELLGHAPLRLTVPPDWHTEPLSGRTAPRAHWSLIDHLDTQVVGDHKLLWELNRQQYLLAPALCWAATGEARYFALVEAHLSSWLDGNPRGVGVNWRSSLEVAYRAITWCWLLWLLREAPWQPDVRARLLDSLAQHAAHVARYLSTYSSPNTHLTGEALGLFYVGSVLRDARAERWRARGAAILESCLQRHVLPDGVYFEQASQYQRYTVEIYLHYLLLGTATGWPVSAQVKRALERQCEVLRSLCGSDGRLPLLGDDDGGLLLPFDHRPPDDVRALLLAGAVALGRADLITDAGAPGSYAYWLCGPQRTEQLLQQPPRLPRWRDRYFAAGGIAVMRDGWQRADAVAVIDAGPHGGLSHGHSHADALAMTLSVGGVPLFIDRGTLTYSGVERNEFRSTASHNTLELDAESAATPGEAFRWRDVPPPAHGRLFSSAAFTGFAGSASGHVGTSRPSLHTRLVLHRRAGGWVIRDRAERRACQAAVVRWQLAPGLQAVERAPRIVEVLAGEAVLATVWAPNCAVRIVTRDVSPRLGQRVAAQCLEITLTPALEALTLVLPAQAQLSHAAAQAQRYCWQDPQGSHCVSTAGGAAPQLPSAAQAELVWCCAPAGGNALQPELAAALWAPGARQGQPDESADSGRMLVMERQHDAWAQLPVELPSWLGE